MTDYVLTEVDLSLINLDPMNPRIPQSLHGKTEKDILEYMVDNASVIELIDSIGENGFFPGEPIILVEENSKYKVIEGNRRVSALKLLQNLKLSQELSPKLSQSVQRAEHKPTLIPALITTKNDKEVHKFLGFRHITGIKNWNALEKARYLYKLKTDLIEEQKDISINALYDELAKSIGSRKDYVRRILTAYELYRYIETEKFFNIEDLNDRSFHFVNLSDSLNRTNISKFLGVNFELDNPIDNINAGHLEEWTHWLFQKSPQYVTRVKGTSSQLSMLNEIVGNKTALEAFRNGKSLNEAIFLTQHMDNIFNDSIAKALDYLKEADNLVHKMDSFYSTLEEDLKEIAGLCRKIKTVKDQKSGDDFDL